MTSAAMEDDNHVAHVDETGYEEDDEGGVHMKRNKSKSNLSKFTTSKVPSRNLKRSALIRDSFALKEHRWKLHDPFVVDPTDSFTLDALEPTKCAIKAIEANFVEVEDSIEAIESGLVRAFVNFDKSLEAKLPTSGACALLVAMLSDHLFVANAGDSRALLVQYENERYVPMQLSNDLNTSNIDERTRLSKEHPNEDDLFENNRIKGALEPTRGFGDFKLKLNNTSESNDKSGNKETNNDSSDEHEHKWTPPYITAAPEVMVHLIQPIDRFLILATDGLWEKFSNTEVAEVVTEAVYEGKSIATKLIEKFVARAAGGSEEEKLAALTALAGRSRRAIHDDVTIIVVEFDHEALSSPTRKSIGEAFTEFSYDTSKGESGKLHPKFLDVSSLMHPNLTSDPDTSDHY